MSDFDEIYSRLGKHERVVIGEALARIDAKLEARAKLADSLMTILGPHIRKLIKDELNERT